MSKIKIAIWPDSALNTLKKIGHAELTQKINYPKIYAEYLSAFPEFSEDFEFFLKSNYSKDEIEVVKTKISSYRNGIMTAKWRYWAKVYSIYFGLNKFLKIERIDADTVGEALSKLELKVDSDRKHGNSRFYQVLNS